MLWRKDLGYKSGSKRSVKGKMNKIEWVWSKGTNFCSQVQAAHHMIGQWIQEARCWGKEETLIGEPADWEDGRLVPQNHHLTGFWMPGSFIDQRERSNEELKSKGRIKRERQWGIKLKGSSALQNISKKMASFWKGYVNLSCSQVGGDKLSLPELNKGTLVSSQAEGRVLQASHWVWL